MRKNVLLIPDRNHNVLPARVDETPHPESTVHEHYGVIRGTRVKLELQSHSNLNSQESMGGGRDIKRSSDFQKLNFERRPDGDAVRY